MALRAAAAAVGQQGLRQRPAAAQHISAGGLGQPQGSGAALLPARAPAGGPEAATAAVGGWLQELRRAGQRVGCCRQVQPAEDTASSSQNALEQTQTAIGWSGGLCNVKGLLQQLLQFYCNFSPVIVIIHGHPVVANQGMLNRQRMVTAAFALHVHNSPDTSHWKLCSVRAVRMGCARRVGA